MAQLGKNLSAVQETLVWSWVGPSPGEGNGNQLQYSCLGNPMDRGAWQGVAKSQTQLTSYTITTTMISRASILWALGMCPTEGTLYSGSMSTMPPAKGTQHAVRRMGALGKQPLPNWSHQEGCVLLKGSQEAATMASGQLILLHKGKNSDAKSLCKFLKVVLWQTQQ